MTFFKNIDKIKDYIITSVIILLLGMAIQFITHTIIVYGLGLPDTGIRSIIWTWKEILILILGGISVFLLFKKDKIKIIRNKGYIRRSILILGISFIISMMTSLFIHHQSIVTFIVSAKFNYFPLIIGCIGLLIGECLNDEDKNKIIKNTILIIKAVLIFGLFRYILLHTFPNGLDRIGYAQPGSSIERTANTPPPSLWLTEFYTGYVRNQGPFGGPLSFGFWLSCLRPLFYAKVLFQKKVSQTRGWGILYVAMVFSTFSRAAWGIFFITSILMAIIVYRKHIRTIIISGIIAIMMIGGYITLGGKSEIFIRTRSDSGHKEFINEGVKMIKDNRLWGLGAASVGPASYHIEGEKAFNPENQYMQIWLEYGILGLIGWFLSYCIFISKSIKNYRQLFRSKKKITTEDIIRIFPGLSFFGLCVANIVLHPMTDSSSIYPYMILSGILISYGETYLPKETEKSILTPYISNNTNKKKDFFRPVLYSMTIFRGLFFVIQTVIVYSFKIVDSTIIVSLLRDIIFIIRIASTLFIYRSYIIPYIRQYKIILSSTLGILCIMGYHGLTGGYQSDNFLSFIAGIKFDIQYIIILCCGLWLGFIIAKKGLGQKLNQYMQWFLKFSLIILGGGIIRQISKNIRPDFFTDIIGMSSPRDFIPFANPPLYYLTGSGGIERLSGLFVGPNTLGFFMVAFFSFIMYSLRKNKYYIIIAILYIITVIATFSRGAVIGIAVQMILIIVYSKELGFTPYNRNRRKKIFLLGSLGIATGGILLGVNQRKSGSNLERVSSMEQTRQIVGKKLLLGYGPGYVGPGEHYSKDYINNQKNPLSMIENIYLQIIINQGIIGFLLWVTIRVYLLLQYKHTYTYGEESEIFKNLTIGLIGLLIVGVFLHVFIDSMVNYLFFTIYSISLSYNITKGNTNNKELSTKK